MPEWHSSDLFRYASHRNYSWSGNCCWFGCIEGGKSNRQNFRLSYQSANVWGSRKIEKSRRSKAIGHRQGKGWLSIKIFIWVLDCSDRSDRVLQEVGQGMRCKWSLRWCVFVSECPYWCCVYCAGISIVGRLCLQVSILRRKLFKLFLTTSCLGAKRWQAFPGWSASWY